MLTFNDLVPTKNLFVERVIGNSQVQVKFDLYRMYDVLSSKYGNWVSKHISRKSFFITFMNIFNENIYQWNRAYELLSQDYDFKNGERETTNNEYLTSSNDENNTFDTPQFENIEDSHTMKVLGNSESKQNANNVVERGQINDNIQINTYLEVYRRFNLYEVVKVFESLFVTIF